MTQAHTALLPCPFCGGQAGDTYYQLGWFISCKQCCASTKVTGSEALAIKAWNTRTLASQAQRAPLSDEITDTDRLEHLIAADALVCEWASEVDSTFTLMYATADMTLEESCDKTRYPSARAAIDADIEADKQRIARGRALAAAHGYTQEQG